MRRQCTLITNILLGSIKRVIGFGGRMELILTIPMFYIVRINLMLRAVHIQKMVLNINSYILIHVVQDLFFIDPKDYNVALFKYVLEERAGYDFSLNHYKVNYTLYKKEIKLCADYKANLINSNIVRPNGVLPNNGIHIDGYWYTKITAIPTLVLLSPSPNDTFCELDTAFVPQILVSDEDNDTLTCNYYIDSETIPKDTKTVTSTTAAQTVSFSPLDMSTLTDGNHTMKFEVSDGKAEPVVSTVDFVVDKSPPVIGTVTLSSDISSVSVSGSATDYNDTEKQDRQNSENKLEY